MQVLSVTLSGSFRARRSGSGAWAGVETSQAGYSACLEGDDATAARRLAGAVSLNPHNARYGPYLGNLGREEEAIAAFEATLVGDPISSYCACIYDRLERIYGARGDEEKMRTAFEQVLALDIGDEGIESYARQALGR